MHAIVTAVRFGHLGHFDEVGSLRNGGFLEQRSCAFARASIAGKAAALAVRHVDWPKWRRAGRGISVFDADLLRLWAQRWHRRYAIA